MEYRQHHRWDPDARFSLGIQNRECSFPLECAQFQSDAVGVVIIALATLVVGMFGYRVVHTYEKSVFATITVDCADGLLQVLLDPHRSSHFCDCAECQAIAFLILLGVAAKHLVNTPMGTGQAEAASVLSFACTVCLLRLLLSAYDSCS